MQTEALTTATAADPAAEGFLDERSTKGTAPALVLTEGGRSLRAEVLRSWAQEAPGPLAMAMRRRACELDLLAAVCVAVPHAA